MDHGDHAGHGDMDMGDMCNMNVSRAFHAYTPLALSICLLFPLWRPLVTWLVVLVAVVVVVVNQPANHGGPWAASNPP